MVQELPPPKKIIKSKNGAGTPTTKKIIKYKKYFKNTKRTVKNIKIQKKIQNYIKPKKK